MSSSRHAHTNDAPSTASSAHHHVAISISSSGAPSSAHSNSAPSAPLSSPTAASAPTVPHVRASPRLAEKVKRTQNGSGTTSVNASPAKPPASITTNAAHSSSAAAAASIADSILHSPLVSPAHSLHTPLSKRGSYPRFSAHHSGGASNGANLPASGSSTSATPVLASSVSLTPSPIALPPSMARRKLMQEKANNNHNHPPPQQPLKSASAAGPSSRCMSPSPSDSSLLDASHLTRSLSCPAREYHKQKLPCTVSDGVHFITPRTAAMLLTACPPREHHTMSATAMNVDSTNNSVTLPRDVTGSPSSSSIPHLTPLESSLISSWQSRFDRVHILDARFPYEYEGGHIRGAVNITSHTDAENLLLTEDVLPICEVEEDEAMIAAAAAASSSSQDSSASPPTTQPSPSSPRLLGSRVCILIHCEYSRHRGPKCFQYLRKRDRNLIGIEYHPRLYYPEMYVIQGGYQSFWLSGFGAFCAPQEYVSMLDKRYLKEYSENWKRMKRSSSGSTVAQAVAAAAAANGGGSGSGSHSSANYNIISSPCQSRHEHTPSGSGGGGKPPTLLSRRTSRTRSWTEMDSPSGPTPLTTSSSFPSPIASINCNSSINNAGAPANPNASSSPIPSHPRISRGLSLILDSSATSNVNHVRRHTSAFSFNGGASTTALGVLSPSSGAAQPHSAFNPALSSFTPFVGSLGLGTQSPRLTPSNSMSGLPIAAAANANTAPLQTPIAYSASSPSPSYGWSTEGRSSTPSPFQVESPRISVPSPLPIWNSPLGLHGSGLHSSSGSNMNNNSQANSARATPLSLAGEESPRSVASGSMSNTRSRSSSTAIFSNSASSSLGSLTHTTSGSLTAIMGSPPVFTNIKNSAAEKLEAVKLSVSSNAMSDINVPSTTATGVMGRVFASPPHTASSRATSAASSQGQSPSSALHSMHLRSSPSSRATNSGSTSVISTLSNNSIYSPRATSPSVERISASPSLSVFLSSSISEGDSVDSPMGLSPSHSLLSTSSALFSSSSSSSSHQQQRAKRMRLSKSNEDSPNSSALAAAVGATGGVVISPPTATIITRRQGNHGIPPTHQKQEMSDL